MGGSVHAINKNTDAPAVSSVKIGVKVNADKTKYMVMSQDHGAGQHHILKTDSSINPLNIELNPICYLLALFELTIFSTLAG